MKDLRAKVSSLELHASRTPIDVGKACRKMGLAGKDLGRAVGYALESSEDEALVLTRGLLATARTVDGAAGDADELVDWGRRRGAQERRVVARALVAEGGVGGGLFLVHAAAGMTRADARAYMKDYVATGGPTEAVALWLKLAGGVLREHTQKDPETAGVVVDALGDAANWVVDRLEEGVDAVLESIEAIVDAIAEAGLTIARVLAELAAWTVEAIADVFRALLEAGVALAEFVGAVVRAAYDLASTFVQALLEAGVRAVEILAEVVGDTYWALRRVVFGLLEGLGRVGDILQAVIELAEDAASELWRLTLLAIRYAQNRIGDVVEWLGDGLEWALEQGAAAVEALVRAWEEIGEALEDLYDMAAGLATEVWDFIGEATVRIGNSVSYVWHYIKEDVVPAVFDFVRGVLRAGFAVASMVAWALEEAVEILGEVIRAALDVGATLGEMLVETMLNPRSALENFLNALAEIGTTLSDLYQAVIVETAEEFMEEVTTMLVELGRAVGEILDAVFEVAAGAVGTAIGILFQLLGTWREMTDDEIADARTVFADTIDYSTVRLSTEGAANSIVFGVQDWVTGEPDSRAFVTNTLINFDPDDGGITRHTLIHELTHVWQFTHTGPEYLLQAVGAQVVGDGYNYGYTEDTAAVTVDIDHDGNTAALDAGRGAGLDGGAALDAAGGNFDAFNREQQGQIMMHFFVRNTLLGVGTNITDATGAVLETVDVTSWQPYVDAVQAA